MKRFSNPGVSGFVNIAGVSIGEGTNNPFLQIRGVAFHGAPLHNSRELVTTPSDMDLDYINPTAVIETRHVGTKILKDIVTGRDYEAYDWEEVKNGGGKRDPKPIRTELYEEGKNFRERKFVPNLFFFTNRCIHPSGYGRPYLGQPQRGAATDGPPQYSRLQGAEPHLPDPRRGQPDAQEPDHRHQQESLIIIKGSTSLSSSAAPWRHLSHSFWHVSYKYWAAGVPW